MDREEIETILEEFKTEHVDLMALEPRVEIISCNCHSNYLPDLKIYVWHPFIFDNRLVPEEFEGIEVINVTESSTLPPSLNPPCDCYRWQVENPVNYVGFVDEYFEVIRKNLRSQSMLKAEMLDALTGDFKKHVAMWYMMYNDWKEDPDLTP